MIGEASGVDSAVAIGAALAGEAEAGSVPREEVDSAAAVLRDPATTIAVLQAAAEVLAVTETATDLQAAEAAVSVDPHEAAQAAQAGSVGRREALASGLGVEAPEGHREEAGDLGRLGKDGALGAGSVDRAVGEWATDRQWVEAEEGMEGRHLRDRSSANTTVEAATAVEGTVVEGEGTKTTQNDRGIETAIEQGDDTGKAGEVFPIVQSPSCPTLHLRPHSNQVHRKGMPRLRALGTGRNRLQEPLNPLNAERVSRACCKQDSDNLRLEDCTRRST